MVSLSVLGLSISTPDTDDSGILSLSANLSTTEDIPSTHHRIFRRARWDPSQAANDATWNAVVANGAALNCLMRRTDKDAGKVLRDQRDPPSAESTLFVNHHREENRDLLRKWYWFEITPSKDATKLDSYWGWGDANRANGLLTTGRNQRPYRVEHFNPRSPDPPRTQSYVVDGRNYWASTAKAAFVLNRVDGAMYVQAYTNPRVELRNIWGRVIQKEELPAIRHLSDILWLYWGNKVLDPPALRYYGIMKITNPTSQSIIMRALRYQEPDKWPGMSFTPDEEAGKALIGSIGGSLAQLLFQHKPELGVQHIKSMNVFHRAKDDWGWDKPMWTEMLFYIEDVPSDKLIPQEADDWQPYGGAGPADTAEYADSMNGTLPLFERDEHGHYLRTHKL
ncbi:hypothetical protein T440DRAFT_459454 [Plenodomus tracheiphilus IPT5]|uniref:Uncharacterized protein n=1 Tax=Plenodomus tracheiphilus IPT5 TaxID=1408161 RepID=A0A6A7AUM7_9PLEO|nr:hypothetical protein T440DRAFT_459454 [Plenodomus tracheiphilus IPT5]